MRSPQRHRGHAEEAVSRLSQDSWPCIALCPPCSVKNQRDDLRHQDLLRAPGLPAYARGGARSSTSRPSRCGSASSTWVASLLVCRWCSTWSWPSCSSTRSASSGPSPRGARCGTLIQPDDPTSTAKEGVLTGWTQRAKHLRRYAKRLFWKRERRVAKEGLTGSPTGLDN